MSDRDKETRPLEILPIRVALADETNLVFETHEQFVEWLDNTTPSVGDRVAFGHGSWIALKEYIASKAGIMSVELFDSLSPDGSSVDAMSVEPGQVEETLPRSPVFSVESKKAPPPLPPKIPAELPKGPVRTQQYGSAQDFGLRPSDEKAVTSIRDTEEHPFPDWIEDPGETVSDAASPQMTSAAEHPGPSSDSWKSAHEKPVATPELPPIQPKTEPEPQAVQYRPTRTMADPDKPRYSADAPTLSFEGEERPQVIHEVSAPSGALKGFILGVATTCALLAMLYLGGMLPIGGQTADGPMQRAPVSSVTALQQNQQSPAIDEPPTKTDIHAAAVAEPAPQKNDPKDGRAAIDAAATQAAPPKDAGSSAATPVDQGVAVQPAAIGSKNAPPAPPTTKAKTPSPATVDPVVPTVPEAKLEKVSSKSEPSATGVDTKDSKKGASKATTAKRREKTEDAPTKADSPKTKSNSQVSARDFGRLMKAGLEQLESGRPRKAKALFEQAAKANPKSPRPVSNLGWCAIELGQARQGVNFFRKALRLDPAHRDALFGLGAAQAKAGMRTEAASTYRKFLRKYPNDGKARMVRFRLEKLDN